jgi:demethylmenaquinone methyltransferase / 2-methoxy-6-polyprenyl-1,4-benzoquinol methylase
MVEMADFGYQKVPAVEKEKYVLRHFNSIARKYDFMNTLLSFGLHYLWKRKAVKALKLRKGDRVADVCGGTADLSILAGRAVGSEGRVFLYDINREMMEVGKLKIVRKSLEERIRLLQGDAEGISLASGQLDAVMVSFGIRNLTRMGKGLEEMHRILKPGGMLMCLEFSRPTSTLFRRLYDFYSFHIMPWVGKFFAGTREAYVYLPESIRLFPLPEELSAILRRIGFSEVHYRRLTNGIAVIHVAKK